MNIFTIGFTQKSAEEFFTLLAKNNIECLIDVRLNNISQLAGFAKAKDLQYFLKKICDIDYVHNIKYAPTKDILDDYKKKKISWQEYETKYNNLIKIRHVEQQFLKDSNGYNNICLLCSENTAQYCHRRLLAQYLKNNCENVIIKHI